MLMNQWQQIAAVRFKFKKRIQAAVDEARNKKKYGLKDELKPNPTQEEALQHALPIDSVTIRVGSRDFKLTIQHPEEWLDVVESTYKLYAGTLIGDIMQAYYDSYDTYPRRPDVLSGLKGISRSTFYSWRSEFLSDAVLLATKKGLTEKI